MDKKMLAQTFCVDCQERIQRVVQIIQTDIPLSNAQLDQIHQEFDTLFGGARAVNFPELEHYFRVMARYARYLRNMQLDGRCVETSAWQALSAGCQLGQKCDGKLKTCRLQWSGEQQQLLEGIEGRMLNPEN